jgi:hypothetical protein
MSLDEKRNRASVIFTGEVIGSSSAEYTGFSSVTFRVIKSQKEVRDRYVTVIADQGSSCGYTFEVGGIYTVLAADRDGKLYTDYCSGNELQQPPPMKREASYYLGDWLLLFISQHILTTAGLLIFVLLAAGIVYQRTKLRRLH